MATGTYTITGIQCGFDPNGRVPERMELDALWSSDKQIHDDQLSLYLEALSRIQKKDIKDRLSWFQLAGM